MWSSSAERSLIRAPKPLNIGVCVLCNCPESRRVHRGPRFAPEAEIRACTQCGFVFLWPRPDDNELASYYTSEYRAEYTGVVAPEATYRNGVAAAQWRAERVRPLLPPGARVLDVGSSSGAFLEAVRPLAAYVLGVEPAVAHREWAGDVLGLNTVANLADVGAARFDVITLFHTLEHVTDPVAFVARLAGHLVSGGVLVIEVPNVDDALVSLYAVPSFLAMYYQRAHLFYFSSATLAATVKAAGGEAEVCGIQRYDLSNHLWWMLTGQPGGQGFYRNVLGDLLHDAYARALIDAGRADTLWAVARFPTKTQ